MAEKWWNEQYDSTLTDAPKHILKQIQKGVQKLVKSGQITGPDIVHAEIEEVIKNKLEKYEETKHRARLILKKEGNEVDIRALNEEVAVLDRQLMALSEQKRNIIDQTERERQIIETYNRKLRETESEKARIERAIRLENNNIDNCKVIYRKLIEEQKNILRAETAARIREDVKNEIRAQYTSKLKELQDALAQARAAALSEKKQMDYETEIALLKGKVRDLQDTVEEERARTRTLQEQIRAQPPKVEPTLRPEPLAPPVAPQIIQIVPIIPRKIEQPEIIPIKPRNIQIYGQNRDISQNPGKPHKELQLEIYALEKEFNKTGLADDFIELVRSRIKLSILRGEQESGLTTEQLTDWIYQVAGQCANSPTDTALETCKRALKPADFDSYFSGY